MKKSIYLFYTTTLVTLLLLFSNNAYTQSSKNYIEGNWYAESMDSSTIKIIKLRNGSYEGSISNSANDQLVGHRVIYDFVYDSEKNLYSGTIYSATRKMELDGEIIIEKSGRLKITATKFFITRTFYWTKLK